jgi:hypothetical protein
MKYARIEAGKIAEVFQLEPVLHPTLMADVHQVDDAAQVGWLFDGVTASPPLPPPPLSKPELKALAADKRFRVETGGLVVGGIPIATDRQAQAMITGASNLFDKDPLLLTVDWSIDAENFVTLDKATVQQNGILIGRHVQASFTAQRQIVALIDAGDITTAEQIEAWAGWPSNS